MSLGKKLAKWIVTAAAVSLALAPIRAQAAADPIVDNKNGVISIVYQDHTNGPIVDMRVRIYRVANVTGETVSGAVNGYDVTYHVMPDFLQFDESTGSTRITGFSEKALNEALKVRAGETAATRRARWQQIAASLKPYVTLTQYGVTPAGDLRTGFNGEAVFSGLSPGLYLLVADGAEVADGYEDYQYSYDAAFVALPGYAGGLWDYGVDLNFSEGNRQLRPKYRYERIPYEFEVVKRWVGDTAETRPEGITVDIYRNGVLFTTVTLNEANGWRYRWTGNRREVWTVVERVTGQNYSVTIAESKVTGTFTLTNTFNPPPPPPPPPEEEEVLGERRKREDPDVLGARRLPQTGQLWWPVPILAAAGITLFMAGVIRRRRS